jgi:hypothetical protein
MSNEVAVFNPGQVPAFARSRKGLSSVGSALTQGASNSKRISIKGGVFRLVVGGKQMASIEERYLDVVIVAAAPNTARKFYEGGYDEGNPAPPDCWSNDGITPDATAKKKQCGECAKCPQNIAGSGQGNSRACRFEHRIAVVLANDMGGDVMGMAIPAESLFAKDDGENRALKGYARYLAAQNVDPAEVITRMKFDTNSATPKLFFKPMRWLTDDEYSVCSTQGTTTDATDAITLTVAAQDGAKAPIEQGLGARPQRTAKSDANPDTGETTPPPAPAAAPAVDPAIEAKKKAALAKAAAAKAAAAAAAAAAEAAEAEAEAAASAVSEPPAPAPGAGVKRGTGTTRAKAAAQVVDVVQKAESAVAAGASEPSEPTVRGGDEQESTVPPKTNLAAMVDEWDDES